MISDDRNPIDVHRYLNAKLEVVEGTKWWIPEEETRLLSNWHSIKKAVEISKNPDVGTDYWFSKLYNTIIHPAYMIEEFDYLQYLTDLMTQHIIYRAEHELIPGYLQDSLIHTIASYSRRLLLNGEYKESRKIVEKLEEIANESVFSEDNSSNTCFRRTKRKKSQTCVEVEKGLGGFLEGDSNESLIRLRQALKRANDSKWFAFAQTIPIYQATVYREKGMLEEAKREILKLVPILPMMQPRRQIAAWMEFAKLSPTSETAYRRVEKAEAIAKFYGVNERVLSVNIYSLKAKFARMLGKHDIANESLRHASELGMYESDEQKLLVY